MSEETDSKLERKNDNDQAATKCPEKDDTKKANTTWEVDIVDTIDKEPTVDGQSLLEEATQKITKDKNHSPSGNNGNNKVTVTVTSENTTSIDHKTPIMEEKGQSKKIKESKSNTESEHDKKQQRENPKAQMSNLEQQLHQHNSNEDSSKLNDLQTAFAVSANKQETQKKNNPAEEAPVETIEQSREDNATDENKVVMERGGKIIYVDAADVDAELIFSDKEGETWETHSKERNIAQPTSHTEEVTLPNIRAQSARPSKTHRPRSGRPVSSRYPPKPSSARTAIDPVTTPESEQAFLAWRRRKAEQRKREKQENCRPSTPEMIEREQQRRKEAEEAFRAWLSQKKTHDKKVSVIPSENSSREGTSSQRHKDGPHSDEAFQAWLEKKRDELHRMQQEKRARTAIFQEQLEFLEEKKRQSNEAVSAWLREKRRRAELERQELKKRNKQYNRELRRIYTTLHKQQSGRLEEAGQFVPSTSIGRASSATSRTLHK